MRDACAGCGMHVGEGPRYHPYAACLMMQAARNGTTVEANLRAVVAYGMRAQLAGLTLDQAMNRIDLVHGDHSSQDPHPPREDQPRG